MLEILIAAGALVIGLGIWGGTKRDVRNRIGTIRTNKEISRQLEVGAIFIDSTEFAVENEFTKMLEDTFENGRWQVIEHPFGVHFQATNRLGQVAGFIIRFDVYMNGIHCACFEKMLPKIRKDRGIEFEVAMDDSQEYLRDIEKENGLPMGAIRNFNVTVRSFEMYIPRTNPLYYDDEVRDAAGVGREEKDTTAMEDFAKVSGELPGELAETAEVIRDNLERAVKAAEDRPEARHRIDRFQEKYIRPINGVLENYARQKGRAAGVETEEIRRTLDMIRVGSENLLKTITERSDTDDSITMSVIEQQLIQEGLFNPLTDKLDR